MAKKYEILSHTADIGIRAFGKTAEELFTNAACGMFDILADTKGIKLKEKISVKLKAAKFDELLAEWLRELLYQYNTTGIIFVEFAFQKITPTEIQAIAQGSKAPNKIKTEIKAVTYHDLEFKLTDDGLQAQVIFDV